MFGEKDSLNVIVQIHGRLNEESQSIAVNVAFKDFLNVLIFLFGFNFKKQNSRFYI